MNKSKNDPYMERARSDPSLMYGSRGDPPLGLQPRGHPPEIRNKRDGTPIEYAKRANPSKFEIFRNNSFNEELIFSTIGCEIRPYWRGMPENEQPHSSSPKGESIKVRVKGLTEKKTNSYSKYTITNDVDRSILAPSLSGEGW